MWGQIGAAVIGAGASIYGARKANKQAQQNARAQMIFQERMSSTAYQRSMADMRAAGLNPMLAYSKGGASAPAGTSAPVINEMSTASNNINTAITARRQTTELRNLDARTDLAYEDQDVRRKQVELLEKQTNSAEQQARIYGAKADLEEQLRDSLIGSPNLQMIYGGGSNLGSSAAAIRGFLGMGLKGTGNTAKAFSKVWTKLRKKR